MTRRESAGVHPGSTASGRRKKPDKWGQELKFATQEYDSLVKTVARLEEEQRALRVKEELLLQVAHSLQALVVDVSNRSSADILGRSPAAAAAAQDDGSLLWRMAVMAVQQREHEIERLYGDLMGSFFPGQQQQLHGINLMKSLCRPDFTEKMASLTPAELTDRLSFLAGKIALHLHHTPADPCNAAFQEPLHTHFGEYTGLIMSAMLCESDKFRSSMHTNLDTLQPFAEPLPQQHWLQALERLQLSEQQLHMLACLFDHHILAKRTQVLHALSRNLQQQEVHGQAYNTLLQQQQPKVSGTAAAAGQVQALPNSPAGLSQSEDSSGLSTPAAAATPAGAAAGLAAGREPMKQYSHVMETQEAMGEERHNLMRHWLLLGLHMGIVTAYTLSPYQQAVFVASSYPSVPRMDMAIQAWADQQQKFKQQQQQQRVECKNMQQAQQGRRRARPVSASSGGTGTPESQES